MFLTNFGPTTQNNLPWLGGSKLHRKLCLVKLFSAHTPIVLILVCFTSVLSFIHFALNTTSLGMKKYWYEVYPESISGPGHGARRTNPSCQTCR